jgi:hypothetical protein
MSNSNSGGKLAHWPCDDDSVVGGADGDSDIGEEHSGAM